MMGIIGTIITATIVVLAASVTAIVLAMYAAEAIRKNWRR